MPEQFQSLSSRTCSTSVRGAWRSWPASLVAGARRHRRRLGLPEPPGLRDALCRARTLRREPDRPRARRGRHRLRRRLGRHHGAGAGRQDRAGAHAAGRKGPADQRQCRLRTLRQCRLARPDLLHAADHARARAGRRDRPHHPVDHRHQCRARPHRHVGARQLPPRRADSLRPPSSSAPAAWTPPRSATSIRYLVAAAVPGLERRERHRPRFHRHAARRRRRSRQHQRQPLARRRAQRRDADRGQYPPRPRALSRAGQFPRQRQGRREHRHAPDRGDDLRPGIARRALDPGRARRTRTPARHAPSAPTTVEQNLPEADRRAPTGRSRPSRASARKRPPTTR